MGLLSKLKKIQPGKLLKKAASKAVSVASHVPGVGGAVAGAIKGVGGILGGIIGKAADKAQAIDPAANAPPVPKTGPPGWVWAVGLVAVLGIAYVAAKH